MHKIMQPDLAQSDFWKATVQIMQNYAKLCKNMHNYAKTPTFYHIFTTQKPHFTGQIMQNVGFVWEIAKKIKHVPHVERMKIG